MREFLLCKYGEIVLKGANKSAFESLLCKELKFRLARVGKFRVSRGQSVIFVEPKEGFDADAATMDTAYEICARTFGIVAISRSVAAEKDLQKIGETAVSYLKDKMLSVKTFKVESKRADKRFPLRSNELSAELGAILLTNYPHLRVDVHNPDVVVKCEIRDDAAYINAGQEHAAGGMPVGSNGRGMLLLSGGIDSPVAGWMMAKRGVQLNAVYFEAFPYTSMQARQKVLDLAQEVSQWAGTVMLHVVSLTEIEEELTKAINEEYFTLVLRRYMMRIAEHLAREDNCQALITGESMGQVASQTMQALSVTDAVVGMPIFRPCIGMDKEEIITVARRVGTFETSILPYEDCCTVFTPKHPKTRPEIPHVEAEEAKVDMERRIAEALATVETFKITPNGQTRI